MFGKNAMTRWTDTINYLQTNFPGLGDHIETVVPPGMKSDVSKELSLGSRNDKADSPLYGTNTNQRHALRGLLLCQRVYFSNLWAKRSQNWGNQYIPVFDTLKPSWKIESLNHWQNKTEIEIKSGIAMFMPVPGATAADLVAAAKAGPPPGGPPEIAGNLKLSRNLDCCLGAKETCYRGVFAWLLKSGLVSLRWFMKEVSPGGKASLDRVFGQGTIVWPGNKPFEEKSVLPPVEAGFICHMWVEQYGVFGWNGHWVISNGDGTICGVNNGEVKKLNEVVQKDYTNTGKLRSQFEGYGGLIVKEVMNERGFLVTVPKEPKEWAKANLVKFNPTNFPGRM